MNALGFWAALPMELRKEDKVKHMVWSFWLQLGALICLSLPGAMLAVFAIGLAKEIWDERYGSGFCLYDLAGNCIGMAAGLLVGLPIEWIWLS